MIHGCNIIMVSAFKTTDSFVEVNQSLTEWVAAVDIWPLGNCILSSDDSLCSVVMIDAVNS